MSGTYIKYSSTSEGIHEINVNLNLVHSEWEFKDGKRIDKSIPYPKTNKQALIRLRDIIIEQIKMIGDN